MHDRERRAVVNNLLANGIAVAVCPRALRDARGSALINTRTSEVTMMSTDLASGFAETLHVPGPHPSLGRHADTFGRLIGSWAGEYRDRRPGETEETGTMEVHFGWVLQGLAVQDTWIAPPRPLRAGSPLKRQTYGTTVRVFYPQDETWRAVWLNPVVGVRTDLIGRRVGDDIVQFCVSVDRPEKWVFSAITARSFLWRASVLADDGLTWQAVTEFQLHRTAG